MSLSLEDTYSAARQARKLESAALARTLTNNPSAGVVAALDTEVADTLALLGAEPVADNQAVITSGSALTVPVTGTYTATITPTIVDGVITGFVLG